MPSKPELNYDKDLASCCTEGHQNLCCTLNLYLYNQEAAPTTKEEFRMGLGSHLEGSGENCQERLYVLRAGSVDEREFEGSQEERPLCLP